MRIPISVAYNDGATSDITFLWDYKDLLDYTYPGDDSGVWTHPDGFEGEEDWRLWSPCYTNHHMWRESYGLTYLDCDCFPSSELSFSDELTIPLWQDSGSPWT